MRSTFARLAAAAARSVAVPVNAAGRTLKGRPFEMVNTQSPSRAALSESLATATGSGSALLPLANLQPEISPVSTMSLQQVASRGPLSDDVTSGGGHQGGEKPREHWHGRRADHGGCLKHPHA